MTIIQRHVLACSLVLIVSLCLRRTLAEDTPPVQPTTAIDVKTIPLGLDARTPLPTNPLTITKAQLGRQLFFNTSLSADGTVSCASCHKPDHGFATADPIAIGIHSRKGKRNAPSLLNRTFGSSQFWDGRVATLEEQAVLPIENPDEMGHSFDKLLPTLKANKKLAEQFSAVFDETTTPSADVITKDNIGKALAAFQRTLLLGNSPVDQFQNGDHAALSPLARTGLWLFESRAKCWKCHSGRNYTDEKFHNTGVTFGTKNRDTGRYEATKRDADRFKFKTPSLRGVARTGPYMHDGSFKTLEDVVRFYSKGGSQKDDGLDPQLEKLDLSDREVKQLVAFLNALSVAGEE